MNIQELSSLLHSIMGTAVNEGISSDKNVNIYPRIKYWCYIWDNIVASDDTYAELDTY